MAARRALRDRLEQARAARFVDLPVPGLDGVYVRYRALTGPQLERIGDSARRAGSKKQPRRDTPALLAASIDALVDACVGVWETVDGKGKPVVDGDLFDGVVDLDTRELTGTLPTFSDPELADELGVESGRAGDVVTALYVADGDVIGTADAVVTHSAADGAELLAEAHRF